MFTHKKTATERLMSAVGRHPVRTAGIAAGAVAGAALLRKAANTAAKVLTINAVANAALDIANAVRGRNGSTRNHIGNGHAGTPRRSRGSRARAAGARSRRTPKRRGSRAAAKR